MSDFQPMIDATSASWQTAQTAIKALESVDKTDTMAFSKALLDVQMRMSIATSVEQKASAAIDKAYQAHGQVASK